MFKLGSQLQQATVQLERVGVASPRLDAELLLAHVLQCGRLELQLHGEQELSEEQVAQFESLLKQRSQHRPVAHLLGEKAFWSLELQVSPATLIPRPDTETLIEQACLRLREWQQQHPQQVCSILELGTGTAAIPLALCSEFEQLSITSIDMSLEALSIAQANRQRYSHLLTARSNTLHLIHGDRFTMLSSQLPFDFILSNPPYIPSSHLENLMPEVALHEPHLALDGGEDGLHFYHYLFEKSSSLLKPGGRMLLEIGFDQQVALTEVLQGYSHLHQPQFIQDLSGHPRVLEVQVS